ncbi:MAG: hypothetical protein ACF8XB_17770, partial [Planctomycetota bacterium JB042]
GAGLRRARARARVAAFAAPPRAGGGGASPAAHAALIDHLLRRAYAFVARYAGADRDPVRLPVAIVALGGYGRRELCPRSALEVVVVHPGTDPAEYARVAVEALFPFLADAGLEVAHRLASHDELRGAMVADPKEAAALLDARFVTGDEEAWRSFRREVGEPFLLAEGPRLIDRWVETLRARHAEQDGRGLGKEPELSRAPGGLLDLRALASIDRAARAAFPIDRAAVHPWLEDEAEERLGELAAAGEALLAARSALHLVTGGDEDRLELAHWDAVHARLSGGDEGAHERRAVEEFLRRLRRLGAAVSRAVDRVLGVVARERRAATGRDGAASRVELSEAFAEESGRLVPRGDGVFGEAPERLVTAFRILSERGLDASERLIHLARRDAPRLAERLRATDEAWRELRLAFEAAGRTAPILRGLADAGVLGALVPEFDAVVGLAHREPRHAYPVDEHLLRAVEVADRLEGEDETLPEELRALARRIPDLAALKIALFVSDLVRGAGEGAEATIVRPLLERLGVEERRADDVAFLVREQGTMSSLGRPLDPRDEAALEAFARAVRTPTRLHLLHLATVCDLRATSATAYSRWPAELLRDLAKRTSRRLAGPPRAGADGPRARHLARMPARYAEEVDEDEVRLHLQLAERVASGDVAALAWDDEGERRRVWIVAPDRPRLLADLCLALSVAGLDLTAAEAYTRADGVAFDRFLVGGGAPDFDLDALKTAVARILSGEGAPARTEPPRAPPAVPRTAVSVRLQAAGEDDRLVVAVAGPDRPGAVLDVARAIAEANLDVVRATVVTADGRVEQTLEVRGAGAAALAEGRLEPLRKGLIDAARGAAQNSSSSNRKSSS